MRFLADMGVSLTTVEALRAAGHDAVHLRDKGLIRFPDSNIWISETFSRPPGSEGPSLVIFRLRNQTPAAVNPRLFRVIADCKEELARGAIVIVEDEGFRIRRLPIRP